MKVLGIDFGTSYSSIATIENGKPVAIKTATAMGTSGDSFSMPTSVYVEESGNILVGQAAEMKRGLNPGRYKSEFKRDLGHAVPFLLGDKRFLPEDLCVEILRYFRETAASYLNGPAEKVFITHPANFGAHKQELLKTAALRAGFPKIELLDEPTAAAIYYSSKQELKEGEKLLVYDLGGGTFDVALIEKKGDGFRLLTASLGIERCGGVDFDELIREDIRGRFGEQLKAVMENDGIPEKVRLRLGIDLETTSLKIKHLLSSSETAEERIVIPGSYDENEYILERKTFQGMIATLVESTCNQIRQIVSNAGVEMSDIDRVLLVGGSTRIPYVEEAIKKVTGRMVYRDADPELAVCFGAAVKGNGAISGKPTIISSLFLEMVRVPGIAEFPTEIDDSGCCREVDYPYEMGKTQVTYEQWKKVYDWAEKHGYTFAHSGQPGTFASEHDNHPVTEVSWRDVVVWCNALTEYCNMLEGTNYTCVYKYNGDIVRNALNEVVCDNTKIDSYEKGFRLPTSMEWELAARYIDGKQWVPGTCASGANEPDNTETVIGSVAWYKMNGDGNTHPVGMKKPNNLAIYDMSGNVWEWCFNWCPGYIGSFRVNRGGSFNDGTAFLQVATVGQDAPACAYNNLGFRLARKL